MNILTGRPDHIEDVLIPMHEGQWFGWTDSKNKVYTNLVQLEEHPIPSEAVVNQALVDAQAVWDTANAEYVLKRKQAYPALPEQFDMLFHSMEQGDFEFTEWRNAIRAVKEEFPKGK